MELVFIGRYKSSKTTSGCSSCGNKSTTSNGLKRITARNVALPSGAMIVVRVGVPFTVSSRDGLWLLEQRYVVGGIEYSEFEVYDG